MKTSEALRPKAPATRHVPAAQARRLVDQLVAEYGGVRQAARAVAAWWPDWTEVAAYRLLTRVRAGEVGYVTARTYDRLWVLL